MQEVMSIYALHKRDSAIDMTTKEKATEMRVKKEELPTFANDVGSHQGMKRMVITTPVFHGNAPLPFPRSSSRSLRTL